MHLIINTRGKSAPHKIKNVTSSNYMQQRWHLALNNLKQINETGLYMA